MKTEDLLSAISYKRISGKEFATALDYLDNSDNLRLFIESNQDLLKDVSTVEVATYLMQTLNTLLNKRVPLNVCKNVYDESAMMFVLSMFGMQAASKTEKNKLNKMFIEIILNSSKFDVFMKMGLGKNDKKISASNYTMEFFWLIPLFVNYKVLIAMDYWDFIEENRQIKNKVEGYVDGYNHYVTGGILSMDKDAYKQYLKEGIVSSAEATKA